MKVRWIGLGFSFLVFLSGYFQVNNDKGFKFKKKDHRGPQRIPVPIVS